MKKRNFMEMLRARWADGKFVCIGLNSDYDDIPVSARRRDNEHRLSAGNTAMAFNSMIVHATKDIVCAYMLDVAFYSQYGAEGVEALRITIVRIHANAPGVPVILDAGYGGLSAHFDADAITVHPYLGAEALQRFLNRKDEGVIVLCRTSNPGSDEFQKLYIGAEPLYRVVARRVAQSWNTNGNCALVVGATCPDELRDIRGLVGDMPILIPEIGTEEGNLEKIVSAGKNSLGQGLIIHSSRPIIYASQGDDFAEAARCKAQELHDRINKYR